MAWISQIAQVLWHTAWGVLPLALVVALACRWRRVGPATRHTLWLVVLLALVIPAVLPRWSSPGRAIAGLFESATPIAREECAWPGPGPTDANTLREGGAKTAQEHAPGADHDDVAMGIGALEAEVPVTVPDDVPTTGDSATSPRTAVPTELREPGRLPAVPDSVALPGEALKASDDLALAKKPDPAGAAEPSSIPAQQPNSNVAPSRREGCPGAPEETNVGAPPLGEPLASAAAETAAKPEIPVRREADAPGSPLLTSVLEALRPWVGGLGALRDALARLPALPLPIWLGGLVVLLLWQGAALLRGRARLRGAVPAPPAVRRSVAEMAAFMGLRAAPSVAMLNDAVSPLIWCGRVPRLVLPTKLWDQLDVVGRRAIICHELAHLKRRDHWVCWVALLVGMVYWWHPLVWWVRRRLHEEADLCCDAWVTWLMPERRRAYAEALLRTQAFVGARGRPAMAGAMGVISVGARRLARRLTMVMTGTVRPHMSVMGVTLACVLAMLGWMALPSGAWADPPEKPAGGTASVRVEVLDDVPGAGVPGAVAPETAEGRTWVVQPYRFSFEEQSGWHVLSDETVRDLARSGYTMLVGGAGEDEDEFAKRLDKLERQIDKLSEQLAELRGAAPRPPRRAAVRVPPPAPPTPLPEPAPPAAPAPGIALRRGARVGAEEQRSYSLPKGKLEALWELMARQDVPVRVALEDDHIVVRGTAAQQEVFAAFVRLIHPDAEKPGTGWVPMPTTQPAPGAKRHGYGGALERYNDVFERLGETFATGGPWTVEDGQPWPGLDALQLYRAALGQDVPVDALAELEAKLRMMIEERAAQAADLIAEVENLRRQAAQLEAEAEELTAKAEELADQAGDAEDAQHRRAMTAQARAIAGHVRAMERQARQLERRSSTVETRAERAEEEMQALETSADELGEALDRLRLLEAE